VRTRSPRGRSCMRGNTNDIVPPRPRSAEMDLPLRWCTAFKSRLLFWNYLFCRRTIDSWSFPSRFAPPRTACNVQGHTLYASPSLHAVTADLIHLDTPQNLSSYACSLTMLVCRLQRERARSIAVDSSGWLGRLL